MLLEFKVHWTAAGALQDFWTIIFGSEVKRMAPISMQVGIQHSSPGRRQADMCYH